MRPHRSGVAIFYHKAENFTPEVLRLHSPNVVRFQMESGGQRWHVVGCYIAPYDASTIEAVVMAIIQRPLRTELLAANDFNVKLSAP